MGVGDIIDIRIRPVPEGLRMKLEQYEESLDLSAVIAIHFDLDTKYNKVFIATQGDTSFKKWCIAQCGHAYWGCSTEIVAVDYSPDDRKRVVQLHECLHLLGVDDCYDEARKSPKPTCTNNKCVMRYEPSSTEACVEVLKQLKKLS
jgi:hypothetical protein